MTEQMPQGMTDSARREPDEQGIGAKPTLPTEQHLGDFFKPDSTEGRGGRPEDLSPDDFE